MDKSELAALTGQKGGDREEFYRLNQVTMSGDDGAFMLTELLFEKKDKAEKYPKIEFGNELPFVLLKMRWRLSKYVEDGDRGQYITSTEYDDKNKDHVTVFPSKDKGLAVSMKERHALGTQRVLYGYLPARKEIVRIIVKASALSGDKNPNGEMGLFEYVDLLNETDKYLHENITVAKGVHRADSNGNKRKDYFAMTFALGRPLTEAEVEEVVGLVKEVHQKTVGAKKPVEVEAASEGSEGTDYANGYNPDEIPFN